MLSGAGRRAVVPVTHEHLVGIRVGDHVRPGRPVPLHLGAKLGEVHRLFVDPLYLAFARHEQVRGVRPDEVTHRVEIVP